MVSQKGGVFGLEIPSKSLLYLAIFSAIVLLAPFVLTEPYHQELLFMCHYYVILACSWDFLSGYTGNINFGHAFFVGGAGYTAALLNLKLSWGPWLTLPIGGLVAAFSGLLVGYVTLRMRGPYFAAVTFSFATLLYKSCRVFWRVSGGEEGLGGVDYLMKTTQGNYYFSAIFMLSVIFILYFLSKSSLGLILKSIGENETVSEASGINTTFYKVVAFIISGSIAGLAGAMYVHVQMHVGPEVAHDSLSILVLIMAVVGGMGSIIGPVIGAYFLTLVNENIRFLGEFRMLVYTCGVLMVVFWAPKGMLDIIIRGLRRLKMKRDNHTTQICI